MERGASAAEAAAEAVAEAEEEAAPLKWAWEEGGPRDVNGRLKARDMSPFGRKDDSPPPRGWEWEWGWWGWGWWER